MPRQQKDALSLLTLSCRREIGGITHEFYEPLEIGPFTLCAWSKVGGCMSFTLYNRRSGAMVAPAACKRLRKCGWACDDFENATFSAAKFETIVDELARIF